MRFNLIILFSLMLLVSCGEYGNPFVDDVNDVNIKSQIKYSANPETSSLEYKIYEKYFNESGELESVLYFDKNSNKVAESQFEYSYNTKNEIYIKYDGSGDTLSITNKNFKLNDQGQVLSIEVYSNGELKERSDLEYNNNGNISAEKVIGNDGLIHEKKYEYNYNQKGDLELIFTRDEKSGEIIQKDSLVYSSNKLEMISYNREGKISQIHQLNYDEHGLIIKEQLINANGKVIELYIYQYTFY